MRILMSLAFLALCFPATAEVTNGRACKEHLAPLFEIRQNATLSADVYGAIPNAVGVPMNRFLLDYQSDSRPARDYINRVRRVLLNCTNHCEGLQIHVNGSPTEFHCSVVYGRSIDDLAANIGHISDDDTVVADNAAGDPDLDAAFSSTTTEVADTSVAEPANTDVAPAVPVDVDDGEEEEEETVVVRTPPRVEPAVVVPENVEIENFEQGSVW